MKIKLPIVGEVRTGKDITVEKMVPAALGALFGRGERELSNDKTVSTALLRANREWVYRNNDAIAMEVSKMDFQLFSVGLSAGEIVYNEIESHPLLDLLDRPNPETTKADAIYIIQSHKKLAGDAFWLKIRNGGQISALRMLPPDKITLNLMSPTAEQPAAIRSYNYKDVIDGQKINVTYEPQDIIHFKKPNPNNQFRGLGAVEALASTIDLDNLTTETSKKFFLNGAISNFALTTDAKITEEQLARLKAEFTSTYSGVDKAFRTMILGGGLKPVDISYSNKDMEFSTQLEWYRDKIMYVFGNTKAALGMIDDVNRASHEGSIIEWQRNTVKPDMEAIVGILNEFLVPEFGKNLILGFTDPVPEDRSDDINEISKLYPLGILKLDEARAMADLDPVGPEEGGEEFYSKPAPIVMNPNDPNSDPNGANNENA